MPPIDGSIVYQYPNGAKAPTQLQMLTTDKVNVQVTLPADQSEVDITHNFQFDQALPASDLQTPMVHINAISPGGAALPAVAFPDGNTLNLSKGSSDAGATYDVWIVRQIGATPFKTAPPQAK